MQDAVKSIEAIFSINIPDGVRRTFKESLRNATMRREFSTMPHELIDAHKVIVSSDH